MRDKIKSEIVERQFGALSRDDLYTIGVQYPDGNWRERRGLSLDQILATVPRLAQLNREGVDVHFRPDTPLSYTFVDDLKRENIGSMKRAGYQPAAIIETSPGNFQAWLKHGEPLKEARLGTLAAQYVQQRFQGDPSAAAFRHTGRVAGFHTHKHFPMYVKLAEAIGAVYPAASELLRIVTGELAKQKENEFRQALRVATPTERTKPLVTIEEYRRDRGIGMESDLAWARYALKNGIQPDEVKQQLASRDLVHKGDRHRQEQYLKRTLAKAERGIGRER